MTAKKRPTQRRYPAPRSRPAARVKDDVDRCTLCGYESDGSFADRMRHLRGSHPGYARGLLLRLAAPLIFVGLVALLALAQAPTWSYFGALALTAGVVVTGMLAIRGDRTRTAVKPGIRQLLRSGGFRFIVFGVAAIIM